MQIRAYQLLGWIFLALLTACEPVVHSDLSSRPYSAGSSPIPPYGPCPGAMSDYFVACYPIPAEYVEIVRHQAQAAMTHSDTICGAAASSIRDLALRHSAQQPTLWLGHSDTGHGAAIRAGGGQAEFMVIDQFWFLAPTYITDGGFRKDVIYHEGLHVHDYLDAPPPGGGPSAGQRAQQCKDEEDLSVHYDYQTAPVGGGGGGGTCIEWVLLRSYDGGQTWHEIDSWTTGC